MGGHPLTPQVEGVDCGDAIWNVKSYGLHCVSLRVRKELLIKTNLNSCVILLFLTGYFTVQAMTLSMFVLIIYASIIAFCADNLCSHLLKRHV